ISELAQRHVENPREVVSQGQDVKVLILEVDADRRRLSLSMKRVDGEAGMEGDVEDATRLTPNLGLSEEVFAEGAQAPEAEEPAAEAEAPAAEAEEPAAEAEEPAAEAEAPAAEAEQPAPEAEAAAEAEPQADEPEEAS